MEKVLLVGVKVPSSGTFKVYLASAAPSNSIVIDVGGGGVEDSTQEMLLTVWGGPTTHVPGGPSTRAGG